MCRYTLRAELENTEFARESERERAGEFCFFPFFCLFSFHYPNTTVAILFRSLLPLAGMTLEEREWYHAYIHIHTAIYAQPFLNEPLHQNRCSDMQHDGG